MPRPPHRHAILASALEHIRRVDLPKVEHEVDRDLDWRRSGPLGARDERTEVAHGLERLCRALALGFDAGPDGPSKLRYCGAPRDMADRPRRQLEARAGRRDRRQSDAASRSVRSSRPAISPSRVQGRLRRTLAVLCRGSQDRDASKSIRHVEAAALWRVSGRARHCSAKKPQRRPARSRRRRVDDRRRPAPSLASLWLSARLYRLEHSARWCPGDQQLCGRARCLWSHRRSRSSSSYRR